MQQRQATYTSATRMADMVLMLIRRLNLAKQSKQPERKQNMKAAIFW